MKFLIMVVSIFFSSLSFAGGDLVGNGGLGVVCRDPSGRISHAELLDIFEAKDRMTCNEMQGDSIESALVKVFRVMAGMGETISTNELIALSNKVINQTMMIQNKDYPDAPVFNGLTQDHGLPQTESDSVSHCKFEQIAVYTPQHTLLIDESIYRKLSFMNQVALFAHETLYLLLREPSSCLSCRFKYSDTFFIRMIVGDSVCS